MKKLLKILTNIAKYHNLYVIDHDRPRSITVHHRYTMVFCCILKIFWSILLYLEKHVFIVSI